MVPPKVEYKITDLGLTLSASFCGVWVWAAESLAKVEVARRRFDQKTAQQSAKSVRDNFAGSSSPRSRG